MSKGDAIVGVFDHAGWAVFVTASGDGGFVDRRRVELVTGDVPCMPHHHDGQAMPIGDAVDLVARVRASADRCAAVALDAVSHDLGRRVRGIAIRARQALPTTVAERIQDVRARNVADWVMYRDALAAAAEARSLEVHEYDAKTVVAAAREAVSAPDLEERFRDLRRTLGPPWTKDHKVAMAAAILAAGTRRTRGR